MSRDWTEEEIRAASVAMNAAGNLSYDEFCIMLNIADFARVQREGFFPCPRCGLCRMNSDPIRNALSRHATVLICDRCGTDEAMRDFAGEVMPLTEWAIAKNPEAFLKADEDRKEDCNKYTVEFSITCEVKALDSVEAVEKARAQVSLDDAYIYVDGNLFS